MKRTFLIAVLVFLLAACVNRRSDQQEKTEQTAGSQKTLPVTDTLPDEPQFNFTLDGKEYRVLPDDLMTSYSATDTSINISARPNDSLGLLIVLPHAVKNSSFNVPTGYSSINTKIAFSEELAVVPTVTLSGYPLKDVSFNNLYDGYHKKEVKPDAVTVTAFRQQEGRSWILKGRIHTRLLKNVYEGKNNAYNHDYELQGQFVVRFDIWE